MICQIEPFKRSELSWWNKCSFNHKYFIYHINQRFWLEWQIYQMQYLYKLCFAMLVLLHQSFTPSLISGSSTLQVLVITPIARPCALLSHLPGVPFCECSNKLCKFATLVLLFIQLHVVVWILCTLSTQKRVESSH